MAGVPMRLTQHSGQGRLGHVNHGHGSHGGHSGHGGHGGHGGHNHGGHGHGMMLQPHQAHQPHQPHQAHQPHQYSPAQGVIVTMGGGHMGPGPQGGHMSAGPGAPQGGHMSGRVNTFQYWDKICLINWNYFYQHQYIYRTPHSAQWPHGSPPQSPWRCPPSPAPAPASGELPSPPPWPPPHCSASPLPLPATPSPLHHSASQSDPTTTFHILSKLTH